MAWQFVCVCVWVWVCGCVCVCACVRACVRLSECLVCVRVIMSVSEPQAQDLTAVEGQFRPGKSARLERYLLA